jgi:hypothetical protein
VEDQRLAAWAVALPNERLHKIINDNGDRAVNFATSKISLPKVRCCHIVTFMNLLGHLLMGRRTVKLTIFRNTGDGIQVYLLSDQSGEQTVIPTTTLWWQKLGKDWQ